MGKGNGLFGNYRKKVGNTVGYTLKNSNNAQTQGVRIYQPVVTNPKSDPQSAQRMKLMPLQIFYQSFSDVLNHAFEGKKVGQMNRQRFMQLNMGVNSGIAPAVQKGERILAPIRCQISSGSLTQNTTLEKEGTDTLLTSMFNYGNQAAVPDFKGLTLKEFSTNIIANNLGLEVGMELAFIFVISSDTDLRAGVPMKFSIVLNDTDDETTIGDLMGRVADYIEFGAVEGGKLYFQIADVPNHLSGVGFIISKKNASGWSNNNARFFPTEFGEAMFYTDALYQAALATYGPTGSTLTSDLFLRQANNATGMTDPNAVVSTASQAIVLTGDYEEGVLSAANAVLATTRSGYKRLVVDAAGNIVDADGTVITVTVTDGEDSTTSNLQPDMTTFAGLGTVVYGSF